MPGFRGNDEAKSRYLGAAGQVVADGDDVEGGVDVGAHRAGAEVQ